MRRADSSRGAVTAEFAVALPAVLLLLGLLLAGSAAGVTQLRLEEAAARLVGARLLLREDAEQLVSKARNEEIVKRFPPGGEPVLGLTSDR